MPKQLENQVIKDLDLMPEGFATFNQGPHLLVDARVLEQDVNNTVSLVLPCGSTMTIAQVGDVCYDVRIGEGAQKVAVFSQGGTPYHSKRDASGGEPTLVTWMKK